MSISPSIRLTLAISLCGPALALACPQKSERCGPPPEAIAACSGLTAQTACEFTGRHNDTVAGQCREIPDQGLACVPTQHRKGQKPQARDQE